MKTKFILFLFFCLTGFTYGQQISLNQLDSAGKKDGKWIVYLDDTWKEVKDSSDAKYCRYTYYEHGINLYPMGTCGRKGWILAVPAGSSRVGKLTLLDGEYEWHDKKGRLSSAHSFTKGEYVFCKEYYSSGKLMQHFDYTMKYKDQPHTWHMTIYDKKENVKLYYFRKGNSGWMGYGYSPEKN
jgi:hypothetical protein